MTSWEFDEHLMLVHEKDRGNVGGGRGRITSVGIEFVDC